MKIPRETPCLFRLPSTGKKCGHEYYDRVFVRLQNQEALINVCQYHFELYLSQPHVFIQELQQGVDKLLETRDDSPSS